MSHPQPSPKLMKGARNYTGTLYFLFQTLVFPSLITESKYHVQRYKNKTTTVVVFIVSIYISSPKSHLHIHIQKLYICIYIIRVQNLQVMNPYKCVGPAECGRSRTSSTVPTRIKTRAKINA